MPVPVSSPDIKYQNIEYQDPLKLVPSAHNARTHSKTQIRLIAESVRRFGFTNPVLVDDDNHIMAGHGRVQAARLLGLGQIPTIRLSHMSHAEKRAYMLADNHLAEKAGWDRDTLAIELQELLTLDVEIELTGFSTAEIDILLDEKGHRGPERADRLPRSNPQAPIVSRLGDIWICGTHRLICGNALEDATYQRLLDGEKADLIFTDPPYNLKIGGHVGGNGAIAHPEFAMASGEMNSEQFSKFLEKVFAQLVLHSKDGSIHFVTMDWRHLTEILRAGHQTYSELKNLVVWSKSNAGMGSFYRSKHELILVWKKGLAPHVNNFELGQHGRYRTNVWEYPGINTMASDRLELLAMHPTVKPVALVADAIRDCSHRKDIVLDPFVGSGSTLVAAEQTGRYARVIEIEPRYADVALARWQEYSGNDATLGVNGQTFDERRSALKRETP